MAQATDREYEKPGMQARAPLRRGVVLTLSIIAGPGLLAGLWLFARPLALVGVGIVLGEALSPTVERGSSGLPRPFAVVLLYLCIAAVLITLLWFALAPLAGQAQELLNSLPALIERAEAWVQRQDQRVGAIPIVEALGGQLQGLTNRLLTLPMMVATSLFDVLLVIFLSLYWLLASPQLGRFTRSLFPPEQHKRVDEVQAELRRTVGGYVRGVGINVILVTLVSYIGLRLIGLPFALIFAVIAGLLEVVPILGAFVAGAIIVGFALSQSLPRGRSTPRRQQWP